MTIIKSNKHFICSKKISKNAIKVIYKLNKAGYKAYLVGGSVRDLLIGKKPKDFDISTNATPEQTRNIFKNCRLVGRRFRLAHIIFKSEIIEVSTFRSDDKKKYFKKNITKHFYIGQQGVLIRDNIFGSIKEDSQRRDFSINSLYYNIKDSTIIDYNEGLKDLKNKKIKLIGDPKIRYREDPIRMLRAIRFSAKLNMNISYETAKPITSLSCLLYNIPSIRLFEEFIKLLYNGNSKFTYNLLCKYKLFNKLFPQINIFLKKKKSSFLRSIIIEVLSNIDNFLKKNIKINPAFLLASILWYPLLERVKKLILKNNLTYLDSFLLSIDDIINEQNKVLTIPKRLTILIKNIWKIQIFFYNHKKKHIFEIIKNQKFCLSCNFLYLRNKIENNN